MSISSHNVNEMSADLAHDEGCRLLNEEHFQEALPYLQRAVSFEPRPWYYSHNLGNALIRLGRTAEAACAYEDAILLNPLAIDSIRGLIAAWLCESKYERALPLAIDVAHSNPNFAVDWIHLGNCLLHLGQLEKAESAYRYCLSLQTASSAEFAQCHSHLGTIEFMKRNLIDAETHFRSAILLNRKLSSALFGLAQVFAASGQLALGIKYMINYLESPVENQKLRYHAMGLIDQWRRMTKGDVRSRDGP